MRSDMNAEYYVWYRLESEALGQHRIDPSSIECAAEELMQTLHAVHGVQGRLLARQDDVIPTWMEHYALPQSSSDTLSPKEFEHALGDLEQKLWPPHFPKRHTERFNLIKSSSL